ncbi:hypothetical protein C0993_001040 [Termitomyces sp. T159_Od127]|nr:hypothetical protein C0993_001040 [Termitomyces sp. T159_Od127]
MPGKPEFMLTTNPHGCAREAVIALLVEQDLQRQDKLWQEVAKESEVDVQWHIASAGKRLQQGQGEGEDAKEKTLEVTAGAAREAAMSAATKAPTGGTKELALPTKKLSPTKPFSKRRGCQAPRYEAPTQQDFSDKELARFWAPKRAKAVVDMGVGAGVVLKETKGKVMVDLAMCQAFKEEWGACDKCWADNDPEECWYPVCTPSCFRCAATNRPCTLDGAKMRKQGNTLNSMMERTYHRAALVRRAQDIVKRARETEAKGKTVAISKKSLALLTCQDKEGREGSKGKGKASPPL